MGGEGGEVMGGAADWGIQDLIHNELIFRLLLKITVN